jgi:trimeric autotransporter adhesin
LTVNPEYTFIENHAICNGETYLWHGTNYTTTGTYTATYPTAQGCDSVYTLNLTVNPEYTFIENHAICNGETYLWHGTNYTTTGTYTATYSTAQGCDSVYTLNLTVNPEYTFIENHAICTEKPICGTEPTIRPQEPTPQPTQQL